MGTKTIPKTSVDIGADAPSEGDIVYTLPQKNMLEVVDAPESSIAAQRLTPPGPPHYVVFQGNQPVFSDESIDMAKSYILNQAVECKRRGIDVTAKEHELKLTLQKIPVLV